MPEISRFLGIIIRMFYNEHNPPHFHAYYNEFNAEIDIQSFLPSILDQSLTTYQKIFLSSFFDKNTKPILFVVEPKILFLPVISNK